MKQVIREKCFETNSSSEHTITICNIRDGKNKKIEKGKDLVITSFHNDDDLGYNYKYVAIGSYEKSKLLLNLLCSSIEGQLADLVPYSKERDYDEINEERRQKFYKTPIVKAYVKAIKKYIGSKYKVTIEFTSDYEPFIDRVTLDDYLHIILGLEKEEDLKDITKLSNVFYNIIFNDEIEIIDKFHEE